ncbi:transposase [Nonomuraea sp. NPDC005650]|uniref:IS110 family transposase n=1 Tax=Nonomuraea sp. NPDC005650 TaxID=3157045 RepID=UPI0033A00FCB
MDGGGIDPHKRTHTAVAVDEVGRKKGERTVQARDLGHVQLLAWARKLAPEQRVWAVEDVRHVSCGLVRDLLAADETVIPVPPNRTAGDCPQRRSGPLRLKIRPICTGSQESLRASTQVGVKAKVEGLAQRVSTVLSIHAVVSSIGLR